MKTIKIGSGNSSFAADRSDTTYVLEADKALDTSYLGIEMTAPSLRNLEVIVNGSIASTSSGIYAGAATDPIRSLAISIGSNGSIESGGRAIDVEGRDVSIENRGSISGSEGVRLWGMDGFVENAGLIDAVAVGIVASDGTRIVNSGTIGGGMYGIVFNALKGEGGVLANSGAIAGGSGGAIFASVEADRIVNRGLIDGDVSLRDGDDVMVFKGGTVTGSVNGGLGDDTYVVRSLGPVIEEYQDQGNDLVRSSISWTIGDNIEGLQLTGRKDLDGFGSSTANRLTGNSGDNSLYGRAGDDILRGGAGKDMLTGDQDADVFIFTSGTGRDTVMDFEAGIDEIRLGGLKGAGGFDDMLANHVVEKGADLWIAYGDDVIVLKDTATAELQAGDFVF